FYDQGVSIAQVIGLATAFALAISPWLSRLRPELGTPLPVAPSATLATATSLANLPVFWPFRALAALVALVALPRLPLAPKVRIALAALVTVGVFMGGETVYKLVRKVEIYTENQSPEAPSPNAAAAPPVRTDSADWKAQDTTGLVAEAKVLPFSAMAKRAASHPIVFVLGLLGVLLLFVTRPALLPLAPLFGVGGFAFFGGHRFLIYLVPFIGLGLAFLGVQGGRLLARLVPTRRAPVAAIGATALVLAATVPSALQTVAAPPSPAMIVPEIEALEALDRLSKSDDVTIAWWDFGYPIAYFGHTRTITDGSLRGDDAALAAEILLTDSAPLARNLSLLAADALDHSPADGAAVYLFGAAKQAGLGPVDFLGAVRAGRWPIPDPPHDVYLYLPLRIVPIIQALEIYRPTGLHDRRTPPFTRLYRNVKSEGGKLLLGEGLEVDADTVAIWRTNAKGQREKKALHSIHVISRAQPGSSDATPSGATTKRSRPGDPRADTAGVLLRDLRVFIELEPRLLSSVWASLFLFDNADPQSFEPVFENEAAKIYRVRRSAPTTRAPTP
ncbi:MAG: hypothetical protein JNJ59_27420, partial [Deltaproteobacteria bacterium]|nr:hypothetical protein [Deltaproteobacteria bacterium]